MEKINYSDYIVVTKNIQERQEKQHLANTAGVAIPFWRFAKLRLNTLNTIKNLPRLNDR